MLKYYYYEDAGHSWLKVPKARIQELGIANQITQYSYQRQGYAYLEEDSDAGTFLTAFEQQYGCMPLTDTIWDGDTSPIRDYPHYEEA